MATSDEVNFIKITIPESQKVGEGMSSYISYKVVVNTNSPLFKNETITVWRRFSDFLGLHDKLVNKYVTLGYIIPPTPEKHMMGSAKIKIGSAPNEEIHTNNEFLENRRFGLERFLNRIAKHHSLHQDAEFISFLTETDELPRAINTSALSSAGVMRLFNKFGESVNKFTYKMDENDPWFTDKINDVERNEVLLQKLFAETKLLYINRKDLSHATGAVAKGVSALCSCEEDNSLSRNLSHLTAVEEKIELLRSEQSNSDFFILSEQLKDQVGLLGAVQNILHERVKTFQNWEYAQQQLSKKKEQKMKLEANRQTNNIQAVEKECDEWQFKVNRMETEFNNISKNIQKEIEIFDSLAVDEIKGIYIKYFEDQMAHQNQLISLWRGYLDSVNDISQ